MNELAIERLAAEADVPPETLRRALEWLVTLWSHEAEDKDRSALQVWRHSHPDHERAWRQVAAMESRLNVVASPVAGNSLRAARRVMNRRSLLKMVSLLMVGGGSWFAVRDTAPVQRRFADLSTATGEIREITLEDGSVLVLNTASSVNIAFGVAERRIRLIEGEIYIATARDPVAVARPFIVETADGAVRPIGTQFSVRRTGTESQVGVAAGAVLIQPRRSGTSVRLDAGQQTVFTGRRVGAIAAGNLQTGWCRGLLVAERMRLVDFLRELGRYRPGVIRCDPAVADLIVSGAYPLADTDRILAALDQALPIKIRLRTAWWVVVEATG
jgi:transmembrane sensor